MLEVSFEECILLLFLVFPSVTAMTVSELVFDVRHDFHDTQAGIPKTMNATTTRSPQLQMLAPVR